MNSTDFANILQHPQTITHQQTEAVKSVIDEFPYFQPARAVFLKGLKNESSFKYNQELKTTAAYTTDRSILFDFITSETFIQNEISQFIKQNIAHIKDIDVIAEDLSINKNVKIDHALKQQLKDTIGVLDPSLFQPKEERPKKTTHFILDETEIIENATKETKTQEASIRDILSLGKPLQFEKRETHSFNEWLKIGHFKPIERNQDKNIEPTESITEDKASKDLVKAKKFELIDQFITKNPKDKPF